jgi:hypothetical protein
MSFHLEKKNAHSKFQRIMNDIFNAYSKLCIIYIDDVLILLNSIEQHFKHFKYSFMSQRKMV